MSDPRRQLAAIMFTDIVGYTAVMGKDEEKAFQLLDKNRAIQKPLIENHHGQLLKEIGDGILASFNSALHAVECACAIQEELKEDSDLKIRIGIHIGDITFKDDDVFGDGVNIASRLEAIAPAGSTYISEAVFRNIENKSDVDAQFVKEASLKNVKHPIKIYQIGSSALVSPISGEVTEKSIVVLPFVNMSNDPDQEYFCDGITEEIIADLSKLHDLLVISRSSAMTFKSSKKKAREMAEEVNVRYVLEGSVRKSGNNLRITAQLIDAHTDGHLWAEKYSGVLEDVFDIQEKVSRAIVAELKVKLSKKENDDFSDRPIHNVAAYDCYLRAKRELNQWNPAATNRALKLLQSAIDIIGPNAVLYAGMAYTYWNYANLGIKFEESTNKAEEFVKKSFEQDPNNPDANLTLGLLHMAVHGKPKRGLVHFKRVLVERPNDFYAMQWIFVSYFTMGKMGKAREMMNEMNRIEPLDTMSICGLGFIDMYNGEYKKALPYLLKATQLEPENGIYKLFYSVALSCAGKLENALTFLKEIGTSGFGDLGQLFNIYQKALTHNKGIQDLITPEFEAWGKRDFQFSHLFALIFCFAGMKEEAYKWIENTVNRGFCNYPLLSSSTDPINKLLKGEARFEKLLERMEKMWEEFE